MLPTDKRILALTEQQLEFIEYSIICDNPEALKKLEDTVYDPDYEAWEKQMQAEDEAEQEKIKAKERLKEAFIESDEQLEEFRARKEKREYIPKERPKPVEQQTKIEYEDDYIESRPDYNSFVDASDFEPINIDELDDI